MFAAGTGDGWYTTWLPIFDAAGKMYMANSSPRGGPPVTTGYLTNGNLSTTPVVSRLIFAEPVSDSAFYIEVDSDGSGDVVADNTLANSYASFEPLDKTKSTQKWKLTRINM
ncbi:hypothetical protein JAAARDRAFT_422464 [Jaapia argillacea MUCL 33604]|uniref:Uncharacterized protein n=1 Tax=Jaapia argillacea MUCL 33604 TaxID=933084 RepID=A0A067PG24_9AGAM|nr:hypothetical protein JAAARDRAFT_422464 [Jaapia argillacea MUCL 33604]